MPEDNSLDINFVTIKKYENEYEQIDLQNPLLREEGQRESQRLSPLMCRLTVDGEIKQFSCKLDVPPKLWDVKTARATGKSAEAQKINAAVDRIRVDVNRRYQELMQSDGYVTAARLRDACLGLGVKRETLLKLFEQHNGEFIKKVGHSRVQGTYNRYRTIYRHLCEFVPKVYRRDDIPLKELNLTFINNFEYFLRTEKKCRTNTVWGVHDRAQARHLHRPQQRCASPSTPSPGTSTPPRALIGAT